ncbi:VanW family protein [Jonesia quinghaiensis]|uniref:VanW family protein n=1 Tax=Jonesia quinghaiensis TaxID=262806 RepID=UPI00146C5715|nr:VanW family protein [Jonesia quinghaiensis]
MRESPKTSHPKGSEPKKTAPSSASPAPSTTAPAVPTPVPEKPEKKTDSVASEKSQKPKKPEPTYASLDEIDNEEVRRTWPKALGIAAASVLVLAGIYVGAQWSYASTVANGTTVAGIDIGGLGKEDATQKLTEELMPRLTEPAELTAEDLRASFDPTEAGITLDADATVEELIGFSMAPQRLLAHLTGGDEVEPQLIIDDSAFAEALEAAAVDLEEEPVNGTVSFSGGEAIASTAEDGRGIDVEQAKASILDAIVTENRPIALPVVSKEPEITQEITDQYFAQAQEMTVGPITVEVAETSVEIPVKDFTKTISVKAESAGLDFVFDGEKLASEVLERTSGLLTEAEDAHFEFENGKPIIVPGKAGTRIDSEQLATNVKQAATQPIGERTAEVALVESAPQDSVEALEALGVKEKVATFSTPITNDYLRTENLKVAAKRITGYLVKPGEEFDLLEVIGPVTVANGYHAAGVVVNGIHTEGVGGGLSQVATTTYNTGFFAGMTDIAHRPHSYWFERYPAGRESTIFVGSIDMIWRNDSPHGVLMRSYVADGKLTVEAWSTETYKVETTTSPRSNVVAATMTTMTAANCEPQPIGSPGFTVTVTRKVTEIESGEVVIDEANTWRYKPDNGVTCKKASSKDDD